MQNGDLWGGKDKVLTGGGSKRWIACDIMLSCMCVLAAGTVLRSDVAGKMMMKCFLSDMPELRLGLNDAAQVRLGKMF